MQNDTFNRHDSQLWSSFQQGDRSSYAEIYQNYFSLLYEYGIRLCKDKETVKDCIQDLFIKMWVNRKTLQGTTDLKPYLFSALRGTILNKTNQMHRMTERAVRAMRMPTFDLHYTNIEDSLIHDDEEVMRKQQIIAALNNLTDHQKECIFLRFYVGLEYPEIAETIQVSVKASYKIVGRAIAVMRKYFKEMIVSDMSLFIMLLMTI